VSLADLTPLAASAVAAYLAGFLHGRTAGQLKALTGRGEAKR